MIKGVKRKIVREKEFINREYMLGFCRKNGMNISDPKYIIPKTGAALEKK